MRDLSPEHAEKIRVALATIFGLKPIDRPPPTSMPSRPGYREMRDNPVREWLIIWAILLGVVAAFVLLAWAVGS